MSERISSIPHETEPVDYEVLGQQVLQEMGVEDPTFGSLAVSAGDPEGKCTGTLAEAVGRHSAVRENVQLIVNDAYARGIDPEEAATTNPFFAPYLAKDENGQAFRVSSSEELKKN